MTKLQQYDDFHLILCIHKITNGDVTISETCRILNCSRNSFKGEIFRRFNITKICEKKPGRPFNPITSSEIQLVENYRSKYNVGYQRTFSALYLRGETITEHKVRQIFELNGLFKYEKDFKEDPLDFVNYVARYAGQIWHTDLHSIEKIVNNQEKCYQIIAFIDNRSRKIFHSEILENKTCLSSANQSQIAFEKCPRPLRIEIDNGTEFVGHQFLKVLHDNGIKDWRTIVHTPRQNGKIERFWKTLENSIIDYDTLQNFVKEYNSYWYHRSLTNLVGEKCTPDQGYSMMQKWDPNLPDIVDFRSME